MTSPTIIQQPGALDAAKEAFMQSFLMAKGLARQRQQLEMEQQKIASQTNLEGAQAGEARDRAKALEQQMEDTNNKQIGLRFAQAHLADLGDDQAFAADTQGLDEVQRGYAMSARDTLRQTLADIQSKQAAAHMQEQEAQRMQATRERQTRVDAGIANILRSHQGRLGTVDGVQQMLADAAVVDPESAATLARTFVPQLEGHWQSVVGNNGDLVLVETTKGITRNTGINLGPKGAGGAAGGTLPKDEAILAIDNATDAINHMQALVQQDDKADDVPMLSAMAGGVGSVPVVGGTVKGATRPIAQRLLSPNQQLYRMYAQQLLHNQASLMPRGQRSMPLLQSLMDGYIPPSGSARQLRVGTRSSQLRLRQNYARLRAALTGGQTPNYSVLPGYSQDAIEAAKEQANSSPDATGGALNYGSYRDSVPQ